MLGADADFQRAQQIKAAVVLNIAKFVTWPGGTFDEAASPILLCMDQDNPLLEVAGSISGKQVNGHPLNVSGIKPLEDNKDCHIFLVSSDRLETFGPDLEALSRRPVLTVADGTRRLPDSVGHQTHPIILTLVRRGSRIGFDVNLEAVRKARLHLSAELLKLARILPGLNGEVQP